LCRARGGAKRRVHCQQLLAAVHARLAHAPVAAVAAALGAAARLLCVDELEVCFYATIGASGSV
jgi:predicted ATPase